MKISDFFKNDYVDQASYDNLRKIASLVDGQKNSSRKVLYTILEKNIKDKIKVSQLGSKVSEFAEYLHGSLDGVVVNLAQDFPGTNNIPLLQKKGNFGTRFANEASASRYIYTYGTDEFFNLFKKEDAPILKKQYFEGSQIEPMFYVPTLPILLVNGSEGVSSGFAQKILPRDPKVLTKYIKEKLSGSVKQKTLKDLKPHYNGFGGEIIQGETSNQWLINGIVTRNSANRVTISEVPIGYDLKGYIKVLDDLEDKGIIQSYKDLSENDNFLFEVRIPTKLLSAWDEETLLQKLKLTKKVSENYTVTDENNKIVVMNSVQEILDKYIEVKLKSLTLRKGRQLRDLSDKIRLDFSRYKFIEAVVNETLIINKRKKTDIVKDLENMSDINAKDDSYDYLLNMSIMSLTEERMKKLHDEIKASKADYDNLQKMTEEQIWIGEL